MKRPIIMIIAAVLFSVAACAWADDPACVLTLDKARVAPGKQAQLTVAITGTAAALAAPEIPFVSGLDIRFQESFPGNTGSTEHHYRVVAKKAGTYAIGPVTLEYKKNRFISNVVTLDVAKDTAPAAAPATIAGRAVSGAADLSRHIYLTMEAPKERFYANEKISLTLKLFSDWFDVEDIAVTTIKTTEFMAEPFVKSGSTIAPKGQTRYAVLEYQTAVIIPTPGTFTIEPVTVTFSVAKRKPLPSGQLPDLLNDNELYYLELIGMRDRLPLTLETRPIILEALPLPAAGRPGTFTGAVGSFLFDATISPAEAAVGDDLTLRATVTGEGNYNTFNAIAIPKTDGIKLYDPQIKKEDGRFIFEQTLRITSSDVKEIPAIAFSFFDPARASYVSLTRGPFPVVIKGAVIPAGRAAVSEKPDASERAASAPVRPKEEKKEDELVGLKSSISRSGRFDPFFYTTVVSRILQLLPLFVLIIAVVIKKRMTFLETDREYAAWFTMSKQSKADIAHAEHLMRRGRVKEFYDAIFLFMQSYLGARLFVPVGGITEKTVGDVFADKIEDRAIVDKIGAIFADCYVARFTTSEMTRMDMERIIKMVKEVIEYLNEKTYILA